MAKLWFHIKYYLYYKWIKPKPIKVYSSITDMLMAKIGANCNALIDVKELERIEKSEND